MWRQIKSIMLIANVVALAASAHAVEWMTNTRAAMSRAQEENKAVLLDFTGSDWCMWCKKLKSEILDSADFQNFASSNLVLVEVDFPHSKPLSPEQQAMNNQLAQTYGVEGFPTLIILDSKNKVLGRSGYFGPDPKAYVAQIAKMIHQPAGSGSQPSTAARIPPAPVPQIKLSYHRLALKGVTGTSQRKLALINNQTFSPKETASVKIDERWVKLTCREIHDDFVIVELEGDPKAIELHLGKPVDIATTIAAKK